MKADGVVFVDASVFIGLLRWILAALLVLITLFLLFKKNEDGTKKKSGIVALVVSAVAVPFLILTINYIPIEQPETVNPVTPEKDKKKDDKKEEDPVPDVTPPDDENEPEDNTTPSNNSASNQTVKPTPAPKPAPAPEPTPSPEPTPDPDPEAKTVTYKVYHKKMDLDGENYTLADTVDGEGKAGSSVTPAVKSYDGFTAPTTQTETLPEDNTLEITYLYARNKYHLTLNNSDQIETTTPAGDYYYEAPITLKAKAKTGYTFSKWSDNETANPYTFTISGAKTVGPEYAANKYNIIFNKNNSSATGTMASQEMTYDQAANLAQNAFSLENHVFVGWATSASSTTKAYNDKQSVTNLSDHDDVELFALWIGDVTQASITPASFNLTRGDTAQLTVNNPNDIEEYSLSSNDTNVFTIDSDGNITAVGAGTANIIMTGAKSGKTKEISVSVALPKYTVSFNTHGGSAVADIDNITEGDTISTLPSSTKENSVLNGWWTLEDGGEKLTTSTPITGNITYHAHWLGDVTQATVSPESFNMTRGDTDRLRITNISSIEGYTFSSSDTSVFTIDQNGNIIAVGDGTADIVITGRRSSKTKTVAVTVNLPKYTVSFNTHGGSAVADIENITEGDTVSTLPSTTKENHVFDDWWTLEDGGTKLTTSTPITGNITYHAHWKKDVTQAAVSSDSFSLTRGDTATLTITNASELEAYTIASSDASVFTINDNGEITTVAAGSAQIVITGTKSTLTKTIPVTVALPKYTVSFNSHEGTAVADIENVTEGSFISTLPQTTRQTYVFAGWWTAAEGGTQLTTSTPIMGNITYHAHWLKDVSHAIFSAENIELDAGETTNFSITNASELEAYTIAIEDTSVATIEGNVITAVAGGQTRIIVTGTESHETKPTNITVTEYVTITFNTNEGEAVDPITIEKGTTLADIPSTTREGYNFEGWWTLEEGGTQLTTETVIDNDITYIARWTSTGPAILCKAATELHTEPCDATGSCYNATTVSGGKIEDGLITFGTIPTSRSPRIADAYDCDVNNDKTYDSIAERFYVISANEGEDVRLINAHNYDENHQTSRSASSNYDTALGYLPTDSEWSNPLLQNNRDGAKIGFPYHDEIVDSCSNVNSCIFLLENTTFSEKKGNDPSKPNEPRSGVWINKVIDGSTTTYYRIQASTRKIEKPDKGSNSENGARPVIQVARENIEVVEPVMKTVTFHPQGGSDVDPIQVEQDDEIGELPSSTKAGHIFKGWATTPDGTTAITPTYIVTDDTHLYAIWQEKDGAARIGLDDYYTTVAAAVAAVTDSTPTEITVLKDVTEKLDIASGLNITLDLNGHTINYGSGASVVTNKGNLNIKNGTLSGSADKNFTVDTKSGSVTTIQDATIEQTFQRGAVYNDGGTVYIKEGAVLNSVYNDRAALHNKSNGQVFIESGTITSTEWNGVKNESGTVTIGKKDGVIDATSPVIKGKRYGVTASSATQKIYFYDGIIEGETWPVGTGDSVTDTSYSRITAIEDDSELVAGTDGDYKTLSLQFTIPKYVITFNPNGGTVDEPQRAITQGAEIGALPTPDYPRHTFDGWWTEAEGGIQISATTVPTAQTTYFAHWIAQSSDQIVTFNIQSDAVNNYFANVASWNTSTDPSQQEDKFLKEMKNNFDTYQCKYYTQPGADLTSNWPSKYMYDTTGTVSCDKPVGYDTGITNGIKVYLSNDAKDKLNEAEYLDTTNGVISNMIPGTVYRWESEDDPNLYGYVKAEGERRFISLPSTHNVRDLGGIVTTSGKKIKYGRLIRGEYLQTQDDVTALRKLGMNKEFDLRDSDINGKHFSDTLSDYKYPVIHYNFDYGTGTTPSSNYTTTRSALVSLMEEVVAGKNIYFHCTYGSDRTGTIAWLVESLLGVSDEEKDRDYELTSISGKPDRTRYYNHKGSVTEKYTFMKNWMANYTNQAYDWFMRGTTNQAADEALITSFRAALLED